MGQNLIFNCLIARVGGLELSGAPDRFLCFADSPKLAEGQRQVSPTGRRVRKNLHGFPGCHFAFFPSAKFREAPGQFEPRLPVQGRKLHDPKEMIGGFRPAPDHPIPQTGDKRGQNLMTSGELEETLRTFGLAQYFRFQFFDEWLPPFSTRAIGFLLQIPR